MRFRGSLTVVGIAAVLLLVTWWASPKRAPPARPARIPTHRPERPREDLAVQAALSEVERLRGFRAKDSVPMGGVGNAEYGKALDRLRSSSAGALHYLEEAILNRAESVALRVDLLNVVAAHRGDETRRFLSVLFSDPAEEAALRLAALGPLGRYRDAETFETLRRVYEDPAPFEGRYQICLALAENGQPAAVPVLKASLAPARPLDVRCHAVIGLGAFVDEPSVREELKRLALGEPAPAVRQNALRALCRSSSPEADDVLRQVSRAADADTKRLAEALLKRREESR